ncbi:MAG: MlaE family lipid ABC transporter permease subunit [Caulobacteraceae bacterium]|nr:MlaE family lipid ABC transporter permease subunit [Caulobacteraceae bacterium]
MDEPADFSITRTDQGYSAALTGDWTAMRMGVADDRLVEALAGAREVAIDLSGVKRFDTAGAYAILKAGDADHRRARFIARPEITRLLELVDRAVKAEGTPQVRKRSFYDLFDRIGRGIINVGLEAFDTMAFMGHLLVATGRAIVNPRKVRWAACVALFERAGLDALPIVMVTTFFIGAVVGLLGANMLRTFGAQVYVVELVGVAVLREFSVLITAVLLAGRSGSSYAAEIGAMKMNQEIDAMRVLGVDPFDALVFPRFFALLFSFPLLTFAAAVAGLAGGLVVCWSQLGLGPTFFFSQILDTVGPIHFWVGLSKAPVLAVIIAGIGCHQGMEVGGDVESLGRKVTASVVHAIFATIMIDAVFALIYMKLDI